MTRRISELNHIDMERVAIGFCQTRRATSHGMFASLTPLRFQNGKRITRRSGKEWKIQLYLSPEGKEYLYILNFYLPRFLELSLFDKLETVVHELYHISPSFDGDLRRFGGRCYAHGSSQKKYDAIVRRLTQEWLDAKPPPGIWEFLHYNYRQITERYGAVYGVKIPAPKLLLME
jgi:hypothetical protein